VRVDGSIEEALREAKLLHEHPGTFATPPEQPRRPGSDPHQNGTWRIRT
jgi:hypothetical protein